MAKKQHDFMPENMPATVRVGSVTYRVIMDAAEIKAVSDDTGSPPWR